MAVTTSRSGGRATRGSGAVPDGFVPLVGAPAGTRAPPNKRSNAPKYVHTSDEESVAESEEGDSGTSVASSSESEFESEPPIRSARTPTKTYAARRAPPPASSPPTSSAPVTPTKRRVSQTTTPQATARSTKVVKSAAAFLDYSDGDSDEADDELLLADAAGSSTPKRVLLPSPSKKSTPAVVARSSASPTKPRAPASAQTPKNQRTRDSSLTPRSSARARGLPIDQVELQNVPKSLQNNLVGWHERKFGVRPIGQSDEESDDEDDEEDEELVIEPQPKEVVSTREPRGDQTAYPTPSLLNLLRPLQAVLAGSRPPKIADPEEEGFDGKSVMAYPYLDGYEAWEKPLRYAMEGVVKDGVGNCLILLGQRGVGKTMLVERSLNIIERVYGQDNFIPVRLNGLVHTTDRQALRAIARQLKIGGYEENEEGGDWGSNAALMGSLLRMLEPPATTSSANKPIILVVDEFDLFALHPRQSFLYCLLDIVQGNRRKGGMGVIGISSRTDCLSILEKRVRSRCQSQVHQMALPNDYQSYSSLAMDLLMVDGDDDIACGWNDEVAAFLGEKETRSYLERLWKLHGNVPTHLRQTLAAMLHRVEFESNHIDSNWASPPPETVTIPRLDVSLLPPASIGAKRVGLMTHLSLLDLHVCVAAKHVRSQQLAAGGACTLELLYDCYRAHVDRGKLGIAAKPYSRQAFAMAFDRLIADELFLPLTGKPAHYAAPSRASGFKLFRFVPWASMVEEEVNSRREAPMPLKRWAKDWSG